jgi:hypothetical protein
MYLDWCSIILQIYIPTDHERKVIKILTNSMEQSHSQEVNSHLVS